MNFHRYVYLKNLILGKLAKQDEATSTNIPQAIQRQTNIMDTIDQHPETPIHYSEPERLQCPWCESYEVAVTEVSMIRREEEHDNFYKITSIDTPPPIRGVLAHQLRDDHPMRNRSHGTSIVIGMRCAENHQSSLIFQNPSQQAGMTLRECGVTPDGKIYEPPKQCVCEFKGDKSTQPQIHQAPKATVKVLNVADLPKVLSQLIAGVHPEQVIGGNAPVTNELEEFDKRVWQLVLQALETTYPIIHSWLLSAMPLLIQERRTLRLNFAAKDKVVAEAVGLPENLSAIRAVLCGITSDPRSQVEVYLLAPNK